MRQYMSGGGGLEARVRVVLQQVSGDGAVGSNRTRRRMQTGVVAPKYGALLRVERSPAYRTDRSGDYEYCNSSGATAITNEQCLCFIT